MSYDNPDLKQKFTGPNTFKAVLRIRMFLGLLDPDPEPLVTVMDPDPSFYL